MTTQMNSGPMGLKGLKAQRGFTWSWLSTEARVSYPTLLNWARGLAKIPADARERLAGALGITPDQIVDETGAAPDQATDVSEDRRTHDRRSTDQAAPPEKV